MNIQQTSNVKCANDCEASCLNLSRSAGNKGWAFSCRAGSTQWQTNITMCFIFYSCLFHLFMFIFMFCLFMFVSFISCLLLFHRCFQNYSYFSLFLFDFNLFVILPCSWWIVSWIINNSRKLSLLQWIGNLSANHFAIDCVPTFFVFFFKKKN